MPTSDLEMTGSDEGIWTPHRRELRDLPPRARTDRRGPDPLVRVEHHDNALDSLDVEAVLEFAEYVVLDARRLWEEFPLELRRRMQKVLFPEGLVWSNEAFRTPVTCLFFRDLERPEIELEKVVARTGFEPVLPA